MRSSLECRDLVVAYGRHVAADHVSFDVAEGEIFGLLGPNGAGKTSVIRALTTILTPVSGSATIAGVDLHDRIEVRRRIGVLPESNGYPGAQTGRDFLQYHGQLFGLTRQEAAARADRLLARLGLGQVHQKIATYSRGMRQRLGLCRALINDPKVLFLDEPTLGLDPAGKEDIVTHLARVAAEEGTTVLLCTHLLDEVERICDRVAILDHGRVVIDGSVDELVAAADIVGSARVRLDSSDVAAAIAVLDACAAVDAVDHDNARPGDLDLSLSTRVTAPANVVLDALIAAGIEIRAFDRQRATLNDAFLALTGTEETA